MTEERELGREIRRLAPPEVKERIQQIRVSKERVGIHLFSPLHDLVMDVSTLALSDAMFGGKSRESLIKELWALAVVELRALEEAALTSRGKRWSGT